VAGLDDVRPYNFHSKKPIDLYCTHEVEQALKREFYYAFEESKYPGVPELNIHRIDSNPFQITDIQIIPIQVYHHKMPVLGFRIGDFCYITDANQIPENEFHKIYGSKILVLNALRRTSHISHFTLDEAIAIAGKLKVEKLYLTHISHQMGLHEQVKNETPAWVEPAYDGLVLEL
jgi:phosphoribosyl 1,2-cyclic phosphate phosphodiesterase